MGGGLFINRNFLKINVIVSLLSIFINIIVQFINRTILIKNLPIIYIGYNGLFNNIFSFLSILELGIGSAIIYLLYKPYSESDFGKVNTYLNMYKKICIYLFFLMFFLGLIVSFFLNLIVKKEDFHDNILIIYILFLFNFSIGYLFNYYKSVLIVKQKHYYLNIITNVISFFSLIPCFLVVYYTKNFILYLIFQIIISLILNLIIRHFALKEILFLNKYNKKTLSINDIKDLKSTVLGNFISKLSSFIVFGTDNILITKFINVSTVGLYSNYIMLTSIISNIISSFTQPIKATLGNYVNNTENKNKIKDTFYLHHFLIFLLNTFFSVVFYFSVNHFINFWIGGDFLLSNDTLFLISLNMYINNSRSTLTLFIDVYGLSKYEKLKAISEMFLNLFLSIIFLNYYNLGLFGILLGTLVSSLLIPFWYEPFIVFKKVFKISVLEYWYKNIKYISIFIIIIIILDYINKNIICTKYVNFYLFIFNVFINVLFTLILLLLFFYRTKIFKDLVLFIKNNI